MTKAPEAYSASKAASFDKLIADAVAEGADKYAARQSELKRANAPVLAFDTTTNRTLSTTQRDIDESDGSIRLATPEDLKRESYLKDNEGLLGSLKVAGGQALDELLFGVPEEIWKSTASDSDVKDWEALKAEHEVANAVGGTLGFAGNVAATAGSGLAAKVGSLAARAGEGVAAKIVADSVLSQAGKAVAKRALPWAIEGAAYSVPKATADLISGDARASADTLVAGMVGGVLGGAAGFGLGKASKVFAKGIDNYTAKQVIDNSVARDASGAVKELFGGDTQATADFVRRNGLVKTSFGELDDDLIDRAKSRMSQIDKQLVEDVALSDIDRVALERDKAALDKIVNYVPSPDEAKRGLKDLVIGLAKDVLKNKALHYVAGASVGGLPGVAVSWAVDKFGAPVARRVMEEHGHDVSRALSRFGALDFERAGTQTLSRLGAGSTNTSKRHNDPLAELHALGASSNDPTEAVEQVRSLMSDSDAETSDILRQYATTLGESDSELGQAFLERSLALRDYVKSVLPGTADNVPFGGKSKRLSSGEVRSLADKLSIVRDPMSVIDRVSDGTLNNDHVRALADAYPDMLPYIRQQLSLFSASGEAPELSKRQRSLVTRLLDTRDNSSVLAQELVTPQTQAEETSQGNVRAPRGVVGAVGTNSSMLTAADRLTGGTGKNVKL